MKFESKYTIFRSRKCIWKYRLRNGDHFFHELSIELCGKVVFHKVALYVDIDMLMTSDDDDDDDDEDDDDDDKCYFGEDIHIDGL